MPGLTTLALGFPVCAAPGGFDSRADPSPIAGLGNTTDRGAGDSTPPSVADSVDISASDPGFRYADRITCPERR